MKLVFNKVNAHLNFITNIISIPKFSPKYTQIFIIYFILFFFDILENYLSKTELDAIRCWEVKETPYVQEVYGQTDGEDNDYEQMYMRAQAEVAYIDVY